MDGITFRLSNGKDGSQIRSIAKKVGGHQHVTLSTTAKKEVYMAKRHSAVIAFAYVTENLFWLCVGQKYCNKGVGKALLRFLRGQIIRKSTFLLFTNEPLLSEPPQKS